MRNRLVACDIRLDGPELYWTRVNVERGESPAEDRESVNPTRVHYGLVDWWAGSGLDSSLTSTGASL